ncbi:hypothetical protein [Erwinia tasmaniensis]
MKKRFFDQQIISILREAEAGILETVSTVAANWPNFPDGKAS